MSSTFQQVYQFKITLKDSKPPIWRRIQVPENYSFWDLHVAIQDSMGWKDCHLHEFIIPGLRAPGAVRIGLPEANECLHGTKVPISKFFRQEKDKADYWYDFGDDWFHLVVLEKILPRDPKQEYPMCLAGKLACPPEDSHGVWGYYEMLAALQDQKHPRHFEFLDWLGGDFDPNKFDPKDVVFDDPKERWNMVKGSLL